MVFDRHNFKVRSEQVRLLYQAVPTSITGTLFVAVAFVAIFWKSSVPHEHLIAWLITVVAISLVRILLCLRYRKKVIDNYSWHVIGDKFDFFFKEIIGK